MSFNAIKSAAQKTGLLTMGATYDTIDGKGQTVVLLGTGPDFWPVFTTAAEYSDGAPDPIDRWSKRVIGALAAQCGATCQFPSDGPPYPPFIRWALDSRAFHQSPVGMMVHRDVGLMISLRGALIVPGKLDSPQIDTTSPCEDCDAPCTTACPVGALSADAPYDLHACHGYLDTPEGNSCMSHGCHARRLCPYSKHAQRPAAQSAMHMKAFHP